MRYSGSQIITKAKVSGSLIPSKSHAPQSNKIVGMGLLFFIIIFFSSSSLSFGQDRVPSHKFLNLGKESGLPNSTVKCFAEDPDGYLWIGTFDGLVRYDGHTFEVVRPGHVESILACDSGLYIGTYEGLDYLTFADRKTRHCTWEDESGQHHTIDGFITAIISVDTKIFAIDSDGKLWEGNSVVFRPLSSLDVSKVLMIHAYSPNGLLALTPQKLLLYDVTKGKVVAQGIHDIQHWGWSNMYYSAVLDMIIVGMGIGNETQAFRIQGDSIVRLDCTRLLPPSVKAVTDYNDATYLATDCKGLYCFVADASDEHPCHIREASRFTPFNGLAGFAVHSLYADSNGNLWIGTYRNGISLLSPRLDAFHTYSMASGDLVYNTVSGLYVQQGIIYAGMDGGGLIVVDTHNHTTKTISAANSALPGDNIMGMAWDGEKLWLGLHGHGIFCYEPIHGTISHIDLGALGAPQSLEMAWKLWYDNRGYIIAQGQRTNIIRSHGTPKLVDIEPKQNPEGRLMQLAARIPELQGYEILCAYQDIDGTIYYGTTTGIVSVEPDKLTRRKHRSHVWIDRLAVLTDSTSHPIGNKGPTEIRLRHNQNYFTIHFSVPRISPPDDSRFRFRLEGIDRDWREVSGTREISYAALPPGHYILHIVCDDGDGEWSRDESTFAIYIRPPWYATWWAYTIAALLLLGIVLALLRAYIARRQMRYELLYEKRKHELSERERLQDKREHEQAKRTQQERIDFLTNITHELRTPMFLITAPLEEILEQTSTVVRTPRTYLKNILHNAQRITRLIDHLLYAWRPDTSPMQCHLQEADIPSLCRQLSADYHLLCQQKGLNFNYVTSLTKFSAQVDVEKLELILSNLVSNAFKYTPAGGSVVMRFDVDDADMRFSVSDTGIGISPDELANIFQQGYRTSAAADVKGNGLGLYFVRQLANLLDGDITVESTVGKGSTFTLMLPIREGAPSIPALIASATANHAQTPEMPTATHTILVIDDEPQTLQLLSRVLGREYHVLTAADGEQGLEVARQELPDLIICDVMMPRMDGFQFVSAIKDNNSLQHIPIIMFTARNLDEDQITAFRHGADAYLTKPVSLELLRMRVSHLLHTSAFSLHTSALSPQPSTLTKEEQQFMLRVRALIDANLLNDQLSVDFLARELGMSVSSLYKKVHDITGHGTVDLIIDTRIYHAVEQMRAGETNMTLIAERCGFSEPRSFRSAFKNRMGMSPKQYAQQLCG